MTEEKQKGWNKVLCLKTASDSNDEIALILCSRNFPPIDDEHKKVFVEFFLSVLAAGADVFFDLIFLMTLELIVESDKKISDLVVLNEKSFCLTP